MSFIKIILKTNMVANQYYYLQTLIVQCMKNIDFNSDKKMFDFSNY